MLIAVAPSEFDDVDADMEDSLEKRSGPRRGRMADSRRNREVDDTDSDVDGGAVCDGDANAEVQGLSVVTLDELTGDSQTVGRTRKASRDRLMTNLSDEELLEGIRAESESHFAELYNRYFQRIYNFAYVRMRNHAEAEEVVQETFLAVFRSFDRYRGQSSLLSWIYGIAKNTTNNCIRRAKSQSERIQLADEDDLVPRPSLGVGTPAEQFDLHRFQDELSERLGGLADWQTEIFEMRHFENLSIPEISERTARSSDAVRSSLYRVKRIFFEAAVSASPGSTTGGERR
jgi:RNA polymerase sigma-70 factor (ECF subfamily)